MKVTHRPQRQGGPYRFPRSLRPGDLLYATKQRTAILVLTAQYTGATPSASVVMLGSFPPSATGLSISFMEAEDYRLLDVGEALILEQE